MPRRRATVNVFRNALTVVVIAVLLYFPVFAVRFRMGGSVVGDPDVWWHLRTAGMGLRNIEHGAAIRHVRRRGAQQFRSTPAMNPTDAKPGNSRREDRSRFRGASRAPMGRL